MSTPEERKLKSFQRLIAPSVDATDDIDVDDTDDSAADAVSPAPPRAAAPGARRAARAGQRNVRVSLAEQVFATGDGLGGGRMDAAAQPIAA